jgi:hypothetical protein
MIDKGVGWCFRASVVILTIDKCMWIDEKRLFLVRMIVL